MIFDLRNLLWFSPAEDGQLIDAEVTIHFLITDLAQPVTLQLDGRQDVGSPVRSILYWSAICSNVRMLPFCLSIAYRADT